MKTVILFLCLIPVIVFGQQYQIDQAIFYNYASLSMSTGDTVASISVPDSVYIQMDENGPWKLLTQTISDTAMVTVDDKLAETPVNFNLAAESYWSHARRVRFRILATGVDTATSFWVDTGYLLGSLVLDVVPDTVAGTTITHYSKSRLHGN